MRLNRGPIQPDLQRLLATVAANAAGAYLVGGAVRDLLRGAAPDDVDVVVPGDAAAAARAIAAAAGGVTFAMDEGRGHHRVRLAGASIRQIDVSPIDGDIESDLRSRDFTVNAMATPIEGGGSLGEVIDPCGGRQDLEARLLRLTSEDALRDDPLRLLRAARLATELDFEVEEASATSIQRLAPMLQSSAAERQRDELTRLLATPRGAKGVRLLDRLGLLSRLLPELEPARGVEQPGEHHYYDVFDHSIECLAVLDALLNESPLDDATGILKMREVFDEALAWYPVREYLDSRLQGETRLVLLKLAGLLHDVAKPETKSREPDGRVRFLGHAEKGAGKADAICRRLRFGHDQAAFVSLLVEEHLRPTQLHKPGEPPSRRALYRFFRDLGEAAPACLFLMLADGAAAAGPRLTRQSWRAKVAYAGYLLERYEGISQEAASRPRLVTGNDLIEELALQPGPLVGRLMRDLEEAIGAGEVATREEAIERARAQLGAAEESQHG